MAHVGPELTRSGVVLRPGRVLIIDDEVRMARVLQEALGERHQVVVAKDALHALSRLASGELYDVVLCDIRMPRMDGMGFHRRLRWLLPGEADRVVFVSGDYDAPDVLAYFDGLPNLVLQKPIDLAGLEGLVERRIRVEGSRRHTA
ncbi:MAG TPA: response regulator [Polyangiaceae bacterium]|jgi:CheY-like chemotaxis protein